jgi:uncharacterized protein (TIGR02001 family)
MPRKVVGCALQIVRGLQRTAIAIAMLMSFGVGHARDLPWNPGGSLTWTSDYVFRGVSQSDNLPALQAELHVHPSQQWTVGVWASAVRLTPYHHSTELDAYVDTRWVIGQDLTFGVSAVHYSYRNDPRPISYNYDELSVSINWLDTYSLSTSWSPDAVLVAYPYGAHTQQQTLTVEGGYHRALPLKLELLLGAGYYDPLEQREGGYAFGSAGVSRRFGSLRAELNWFLTQDQTHRPYTPGPAGGPWAATVTWQF